MRIPLLTSFVYKSNTGNTVSDINYWSEIEGPESKHEINKTPSKKSPNSYSDSMATLSPFASVTDRMHEIMSVFDQILIRLDSMKSTINDWKLQTLAIKGKLVSHPSQNVCFCLST